MLSLATVNRLAEIRTTQCSCSPDVGVSVR